MTPNEYLHEKVKETCVLFPEDYAVVEFGTDSGTSATWLMRSVQGTKRWVFSVDPYGDKPYKVGDQTSRAFKYDDNNYKNTMPMLYSFAKEKDVNFSHYRMTSLDWIKAFPTIDFWSDGGRWTPKFCFAYLDGDHSYDPVVQEFNFFYEQMPSGGYIVIDDWNLLGEMNEITARCLGAGDWDFRNDDNHHRAYFKKA